MGCAWWADKLRPLRQAPALLIFMKTLIIDDDPNILEAVSLCFEIRWPETVVLTAMDGAPACVSTASRAPTSSSLT
jgi:hypothetical protein